MTIFYDTDVMQKKDCAKAIMELGELLSGFGAEVTLAVPPQLTGYDKAGIDDVLFVAEQNEEDGAGDYSGLY